MNSIYLDNAATTQVRDEVIDTMASSLNPIMETLLQLMVLDVLQNQLLKVVANELRLTLMRWLLKSFLLQEALKLII